MLLNYPFNNWYHKINDKTQDITIDLDKFYSFNVVNVGVFIRSLKDIKINSLTLNNLTDYHFDIMFHDFKIFFDNKNFNSIILNLRINKCLILNFNDNIIRVKHDISIFDFEHQRLYLENKLNNSLINKNIDQVSVSIDNLKDININKQTYLIVTDVLNENLNNIFEFCKNNSLITVLEIKNSIFEVKHIKCLFNLLSNDKIMFLNIMTSSCDYIKIEKYLNIRHRFDLMKHIIVYSKSMHHYLNNDYNDTIKNHHKMFYRLQDYVEYNK
jgi:hypothetical protein